MNIQELNLNHRTVITQAEELVLKMLTKKTRNSLAILKKLLKKSKLRAQVFCSYYKILALRAMESNYFPTRRYWQVQVKFGVGLRTGDTVEGPRAPKEGEGLCLLKSVN